jgi:hypothetical protein
VGLLSSIARCRKVMARKSVEAAKLELSLVEIDAWGAEIRSSEPCDLQSKI